MRSLQKDENIVILPADKGSATVVLDRTDYVAKMKNLLNDAYKKVKHDTTSKTETKISTALKECERNGHITTKQRLYLTHHKSRVC